MRHTKCVIAVFPLSLVLFASPSVASAEALVGGGFDIRMVLVSGLTPSQEVVLGQAEATWESVITGYQDGIWLTGVPIRPTGAEIDGVGGVLAFGGPSSYDHQAGFWLSTAGIMTFDNADLANMESSGILYDVMLHEMGHVLGFGTPWDLNNVYAMDSGQYTGASALAAYQSEFNQSSAAFVPVELGGAAGTKNAHWDEEGGSGLTGIEDQQGRDMKYELMTGWLNTPTFMSQTTIHSFEDIGFTVVPEPGVWAMLAGLLLVTLVCRSPRRLS